MGRSNSRSYNLIFKTINEGDKLIVGGLNESYGDGQFPLEFDTLKTIPFVYGFKFSDSGQFKLLKMKRGDERMEWRIYPIELTNQVSNKELAHFFDKKNFQIIYEYNTGHIDTTYYSENYSWEQSFFDNKTLEGATIIPPISDVWLGPMLIPQEIKNDKLICLTICDSGPCTVTYEPFGYTKYNMDEFIGFWELEKIEILPQDRMTDTPPPPPPPMELDYTNEEIRDFEIEWMTKRAINTTPRAIALKADSTFEVTNPFWFPLYTNGWNRHHTGNWEFNYNRRMKFTHKSDSAYAKIEFQYTLLDDELTLIQINERNYLREKQYIFKKKEYIEELP